MQFRLLLIVSLCLGACAEAPDDVRPAPLQLPALGESDYHWIAARIFENETGGQTKLLTYWGAGEDFPSLGIGHFVWFPEGVDAPFDESFPAMAAYLGQHAGECSPMPDWLQALEPFDAPWDSKAGFDAEQRSERMVELREWLARTASQQARHIVASFSTRWNRLELPGDEKAGLTALLQCLLGSSQGLFAVIDYYNFKGIGSNPAERYAEQGWGLVQVLGDIAKEPAVEDDALVERFVSAAANRLALRVANAPPERDEARWLPGWQERVAAYNASAPGLLGDQRNAFRITPYVQKLSAKSVTLAWFSEQGAPGEVRIEGGGAQPVSSEPERACELAYHLAEFHNLESAGSVPFRNQVVIDGLAPGETYRYKVLQDGESVSGEFRTPAEGDSAVRFVVYADSETEPESTDKPASWPAPDGAARQYLVDQSDGYTANLSLIAKTQPDFIAIAGDLVESGGEQSNWDEFWKHNATLAASVPIVPARGNHEYFGGPGDLGAYSNTATRRAIAKYTAYFDRPAYYFLDQGPVALIVIDGNNGTPERSATDTNWYLSGEEAGGVAPAWHEGSVQWAWLRQTLAIAQAEKQFTFVMFHHAPYTSGVHGKPPGIDDGENFASGLPLRALTELFLQYGVDAVFNGHDEIYEHSVVQGTEVRFNGQKSPHRVHYFTVGIGGDGLRGPNPEVENLHRIYLAHEDSPELYSEDGVFLDGGKHYGHLVVDVGRDAQGDWRARFEPVYVFPVLNENGVVESFERRVYDDVLLLENVRDD